MSLQQKGRGNTVMVFGIGEVGASSVHLLARQEGVSNIIACDKRMAVGSLLTDYAAVAAGNQGYNKTIKFEGCDVFNIDATAELIDKYNPDVILSNLVVLSWKWPRLLPTEIAHASEKTTATLLPGHLVAIKKLMQAVKKSGCNPICIQTSMPDTVNPILHKMGIGVLTGSGNIDNVATEIKRRISVDENVPMKDVIPYLIVEHCTCTMGTRGLNIPYFVKIMIGDRDITEKYERDSYISDRIRSRRPADGSSGPTIITSSVQAASSAVHVVSAILNDTNEFFHAPGPNGLIGGYPVRISAKGVKIELPQEINMEEAIKINTEAAKHEGFKEIKDDGTIIVTDEAYQLTKKIFGFECREIQPDDIEQWAKQLVKIFQKLGEKYGFKVPIY